jgi:hypothetical protein
MRVPVRSQVIKIGQFKCNFASFDGTQAIYNYYHHKNVILAFRVKANLFPTTLCVYVSIKGINNNDENH